MAIENMTPATGRMRGEAETKNVADEIATIKKDIADINNKLDGTKCAVNAICAAGEKLCS